MRKRGLCCSPVSVCLSVCHVGSRWQMDIVPTFCSACWPHHSSVLTPSADTQSEGKPFSGAQNTWVRSLRFSSEITVYLDNGTRLVHDCYGMLIGSHRQWIDLCRFRWPWVTPDLDFKVTVGYTYKSNLKNGAAYGQSYYRTLIGNYTQSIGRYHFQWPWVASDPDFKVTTFFDIVYLRNDTR